MGSGYCAGRKEREFEQTERGGKGRGRGNKSPMGEVVPVMVVQLGVTSIDTVCANVRP